jgi:hypothetical protein
MFISWDTETTGFFNASLPLNHQSQPSIVQLAAVLYDEQKKIKAQLNVLIKPDGWTIPKKVEDIHGISTLDCEKYGVPILSALSMFNQLTKAEPLLLAHNGDYDRFMMNIETARLGKNSIVDGRRHFCTMKSSTDLVKIPSTRGGYKWPKLIELYRFLFGKEFENAHDALADCSACAECFFEMQKRGLVNA